MSDGPFDEAGLREAEKAAKLRVMFGGVASPGVAALTPTQLRRAQRKRAGTAHRSAGAGNAGQGSKWITPERRRAIYGRDGWRCVWCLVGVATPIELERGVPRSLASLDHFLPRCRGGTHATSNLLTCCAACNSDRDHLSALEYATKLTNGDSSARARILERVLESLDRPISSRFRL